MDQPNNDHVEGGSSRNTGEGRASFQQQASKSHHRCTSAITHVFGSETSGGALHDSPQHICTIQFGSQTGLCKANASIRFQERMQAKHALFEKYQAAIKTSRGSRAYTNPGVPANERASLVMHHVMRSSVNGPSSLPSRRTSATNGWGLHLHNSAMSIPLWCVATAILPQHHSDDMRCAILSRIGVERRHLHLPQSENNQKRRRPSNERIFRAFRECSATTPVCSQHHNSALLAATTVDCDRYARTKSLLLLTSHLCGDILQADQFPTPCKTASPIQTEPVSVGRNLLLSSCDSVSFNEYPNLSCSCRRKFL